MARRNDPPPANVTHGALRYVRSQKHLNGLDRTGAHGGRDDVGAFEQETWRGRDEEMRRMHVDPKSEDAAENPGENPDESAEHELAADHLEHAGEVEHEHLAHDDMGDEGEHHPPRSHEDMHIREQVSEALTVHDRVDASEIEIDVKDGVVTLDGTVWSRAERREAEEILFEIEGVVDVINQLRVLPREIAAPFER